LKLGLDKVDVFLYPPEYMINCIKNEQFEVNENDYQQLFFNFFNNLIKINGLERQKVLDNGFIFL